MNESDDNGVHLFCGEMFGIGGTEPPNPHEYLASKGVAAKCYSGSSLFGWKFYVTDPDTLPETLSDEFHVRVNGRLIEPYSRAAVISSLAGLSLEE